MFEYLKRLAGYLYHKVEGTFTVVMHDPLDHKPHSIKFKTEKWKPLCNYLKNWAGYSIIVINGGDYTDALGVRYIPVSSDVIELIPDVGVKNFTNAYIERLNRISGEGGRFLKTVIITESLTPLVKTFWVDNETPITFDGNIYNPLPMIWSGFDLSATMSMIKMSVTVPNLGGEVISYIEDMDILENDVVLQILHTELLADITAVDSLLLQLQLIEADDNVASFTIGLNLGLNDLLPREVITKREFPGLVDDVLHFGA